MIYISSVIYITLKNCSHACIKNLCRIKKRFHELVIGHKKNILLEACCYYVSGKSESKGKDTLSSFLLFFFFFFFYSNSTLFMAW